MVNRVYIRVDANEQIGTGHIMRCISIAEQCNVLNVPVTFIVADDKAKDILEKRKYDFIVLNSKWNCLDYEIGLMKRIINDLSIKKLIVDHYYVTQRYFSELSSATEVAYIDDLNCNIHPVHMLINYNIYSQDIGYEENYKNKGFCPTFLLGPTYAPLRKEFQIKGCRTFGELRSVLVTSGGTDSFNVLGAVVERILYEESFRNLQIYCVIGKYNINRETLFSKYQQENVHFLVDIANMETYMRTCDVCISAGGTTIYELCACGTPTIAYSLADNQLQFAKKLNDVDFIPYIGDVRNGMGLCMDRMICELGKMTDVLERIRVSAEMQRMVDGKGALRIAQAICDSK